MMQSWHSPAKINFYLAVLGMRHDGFHEIDSLVGILDFGDQMQVGISDTGRDEYSCNQSELDFGQDNLIYRALCLYREKTGFTIPLTIKLDKQIPMGAGLGGGSSNATTTLKAVNALNPNPVDLESLVLWSLEIGSDCPLFFATGLSRIRGRGEKVETFESFFHPKQSVIRIALFHPGFGISAGWAYKTLRDHFSYAQRSEVDAELEQWQCSERPWTGFHRNDLSQAIDSKYIAIPTIKQGFEYEFDRPLMMSGSGSSCFCILNAGEDGSVYEDYVKSCWGENCFTKICSVK